MSFKQHKDRLLHTKFNKPIKLKRLHNIVHRKELPIISSPLNSKVKLYEEALRRRDIFQVLWMTEQDGISPQYETKQGETAILAAVAAKSEPAIATLLKR